MSTYEPQAVAARPRLIIIALRLLRYPPALIFALALIIRLGYLVEIHGSTIWYLDRFDQTDMDTFLKVAAQILSGDVLVENPYHPYHTWHRTIASEEEWASWYRPHTFHQAPGYPYALALLLTVFGGSLSAVKITQCILGAAQASVLAAIGCKALGRSAGVIIGVLAAAYGPSLSMEPMVLRETLGLFLATCSFYMAVNSLDRGPSPASGVWRSWLLTGLIAGLATLVKETGLLLFLGIWVWVTARATSQPSRIPRLAIALLPLGLVLALLPLLARNVAVGAPLLALSPQGAINFMLGNTAGLPSGGAVFFEYSPQYKTILEYSQGRLAPTIEATLATYSSEPGPFIGNLGRKFLAIWTSVEVPDNFNYDQLAWYSTLITLLPRFECIWLPACLGVIMLGLRRLDIWKRWAPEGALPFPADLAGLTITILAFHVVAQSFAPVQSRYRLVIVPFLLLFAGWMLAQAWTWLRSRAWGPLTIALGGMGLLSVLWFVWPSHPLAGAPVHPYFVHVNAAVRLQNQEWAQAWQEYELGIRYFHAREDMDRELEVRRDRLFGFAVYKRLQDVREDWDILRSILPADDPVLQTAAKQWQRQLDEADLRTPSPGP